MTFQKVHCYGLCNDKYKSEQVRVHFAVVKLLVWILIVVNDLKAKKQKEMMLKRVRNTVCKNSGSGVRPVQVHIRLCIYYCPTWGEGSGTPLQYSCLENPMDGGAWSAAVHGVTRSRT